MFHMAMLYFDHPSSLEHDPRALSPEHPDAPARIEAIDAALTSGAPPGLDRRRAPPATIDELRAVHSAEHLGRIASLSERGGGRLDEDTFVGPASYRAALHAAGGACAMVRALLAGEAPAAFCGLRPAGHHADRDTAMGFCLLNNVAVAAELAVAELGARRVAIIDWDVHHGNGTAEIFRRRADVLFASIHQSGLFPGTGALTDAGSGEGRGYTINVPVPRYSGEDVWISVLEYVIVPPIQAFRPDLILVSAGFDAHEADPLADCLLDAGSFAQMACHVRDLAAQLGVPLGIVLEGGYDPSALAESVIATLAALSGDGEAESIAPDMVITPRASTQVSQFWTL
jgi:acetoin utilization deacetylase AcuC-like enzyme